MHANEDPLGAALAARAWAFLWADIARIVGETCDSIGHLLGDLPMEALGESTTDRGEALVLVGHSRLRLHCAFELRPAEPSEDRFARAFGAATPLVRILVCRSRPRADEAPEIVIAVDPIAGRWLSTDADGDPRALGDRAALEVLVWSMLVDGPLREPAAA